MKEETKESEAVLICTQHPDAKKMVEARDGSLICEKCFLDPPEFEYSANQLKLIEEQRNKKAE